MSEEGKESYTVCGSCIHGKPTSIDDTRCYGRGSPYLPVSRHGLECHGEFYEPAIPADFIPED